MPRKPGPHLIKPGSSTYITDFHTLATYCGTWAERDDVNEHALKQVKCATCLSLYALRKQ